MITVFSTPLVFISSSSVSGAASRAGTLAPCAKGNAESCFQTWTWGSMMRSVGGIKAWAVAPAAAARNVRRARFARRADHKARWSAPRGSGIDRLQLVHHILPAPLVARSRPLTCHIQIHAQPALEVDRLQHPMARREVDRAVAEIEHVVGDLAGEVPGVLVVEQHEPRFVLVERHGGLANRVEGVAHGSESRLGEVAAVGRKDDEVIGAEILEEGHRGLRGSQDVLQPRGVVSGTVERNGDDVAAALL